MNLKKIFFSYSRVDASDFALRLAVDLKKVGFNVWVDQQDIRAGSEWDLEIEKALETCDCLLFIESEKSVGSNNVLDEVYYALEEHKRVIPIIFHDSKTPFRLQRLQHIDFTKDYDKGLANLINELERDDAAELSKPDDKKEVIKPAEPFFTRSSRLILIIASLVIIAAVAITYYLSGNKKDLNNTVEKKELNKTDEKTVTLNDTTGNGSLADAMPKTASKSEATGNRKTDEKKINIRGNEKKELNKTDGKIVSLNETFAGMWTLAEVEPKAASKKGYVKIEGIDEKKVKILGSFQFYFFQTNDTAFFSVFNGFVGCASCVLQNEMHLTDYDVAFGTQAYRTLKKTQPGVGKAGDTILNAGSNTSIRATVTLQLINKNTVIIKVQKSVSSPISNGFVVAPFVYIFRFTKDE